jgi:alkaline phosphatase
MVHVRITDRIRRRAPTSVVVGTACAAALAAWAGASAIDTTNPASAGDDSGARGRPARNVVLFIGDGMGAAHRTFFREALKGHTGELAMDSLPVAGVQHTDSRDPKEPITDSAAAGTAIATGVKTFNGAVGVDNDGSPVRSVLEAARDRGRATGLVTTSQVTDATPASFAAHTSDRGRQSEIARQYIEKTKPDVILGGGEDWWLPAGDAGAHPDHPADDPSEASKSNRGDLVARARALGYDYVSNAAEMRASRSGKLLGLFANEEMFQARPEGQGDEYDPGVSLRDMTAKALGTLGRSRKGFFLMVEEEAIDEMSHQNNARRTLEAGKALDASVAVARRYAATHPDTLVLVTADHECGGLTVEDAADTADESGDKSAEDGPFPIPRTRQAVAVDWTTTGHTGADVPLTAGGAGAELFTGVYQDTAIHDRILKAAGLR